MDLTSDDIKIKISRKTKINYVIQSILFYSMFGCFMLGVSILLFEKFTTSTVDIQFMRVLLFALFACIVMAPSGWPYQAARTIENLIERK